MKRVLMVVLCFCICLSFAACDSGKKAKKACSHKWVAATCESPETCSLCDKTKGEKLAHTWEAATCSKPETCSVCGQTQGEALPHTWVPATCASPETCSVCGQTQGEALSHNWANATCQAPKKCTLCGQTEGAKLNHNYVNYKCTSCGGADPQRASAQSTLKNIKGNISSLSQRCEEISVISSKCALYEGEQISGSGQYNSLVSQLQSLVPDAANHLQSIKSACSKHSELQSLVSKCNLSTPTLSGDSQQAKISYSQACKTYSTNIMAVINEYNSLCSKYGI